MPGGWRCEKEVSALLKRQYCYKRVHIDSIGCDELQNSSDHALLAFDLDE